MPSTHTNTTCIVGIGNPLRTDDGIGAYVCTLLEEKRIPGVHVISTQQLDTSMLEELIGFNRVIFVDAAVNIKSISFDLLSREKHHPASFSHHINAAMLAGLAEQLYAAKTQFYVCAIPAANFTMGKPMSQKAKKNATEAVALIQAWIAGNR